MTLKYILLCDPTYTFSYIHIFLLALQSHHSPRRPAISEAILGVLF